MSSKMTEERLREIEGRTEGVCATPDISDEWVVAMRQLAWNDLPDLVAACRALEARQRDDLKNEIEKYDLLFQALDRKEKEATRLREALERAKIETVGRHQITEGPWVRRANGDELPVQDFNAAIDCDLRGG